MIRGRSLVAGRIIAKAWTDPRFVEELLRRPEIALRQRLRIAMPNGIAIKALRNTDRVLHLVVGATVQVFPDPPSAELRQYSERYSDPVLEPLAWCARDPVVMRRLMSDPITYLSRWGLQVRKGLRIRVLANSATLVHLVLPMPPRRRRRRSQIARMLRVRGAPITLKYATLTNAPDPETMVGNG